jgi:hypothetical protein
MGSLLFFGLKKDVRDPSKVSPDYEWRSGRFVTLYPRL